MPKFNKTIDELETRFDKWLFVLRNLNKLDRVPDRLREHIFEKLFETAEIAKFTPEQVQSYEDSLKYYRDLKNSLDTAKEEGREEGREIGREERALEIAKEMLKEQESIDKIIKYTGLTKEQIIKIKNSQY
ncbi:PD-(D/E)XK nuclease family transposase [Cytophagaceae bacterium ABcell3]|nr:PD-(D/E)XK nuclease family transposase [Cytophagaceae bacterium ABcell3]